MQHGSHSAAMFRDRFWVSLALTLPLLLWSSEIQRWFGYRAPTFPGSRLLPAILGTIVLVYGGMVFLRGARRELSARRPAMMTLLSLAIVVAFSASMAATLGSFELDVWWELAMLITVTLLGQWLEVKAVTQAQSALDSLSALLPDTAERVTESGVEKVPLEDLAVSDIVVIRPGSRVPADGMVIDGVAEVDESVITGESRTISKSRGATVVAGTFASTGSLRIRISAVGDQTSLAGIVRLVAAAQASSSRAQALADRAAALLFYIAVSAGTLTFVWWWLQGNKEHALIRTATVLVIACPHALGLAIPLVIAISTTLGARDGLLVKDRLALERLRNLDIIMFDKTGTLTRGTPGVSEVVAADGATEEQVLALAAAVESDSEHPIAKAIGSCAGSLGVQHQTASRFESVPGQGVQAIVNGEEIAIGGPRILHVTRTPVPEKLARAAGTWSARGQTVLYVLRQGTLIGVLAVEDEIRPESREAIQQLHTLGIRAAMVTGDSRAVADSVANQLGIDQVAAEVLPADKASAVKKFQDLGQRVAMVGDGVNDAPALATADVGIAIGAGTDVAVGSAGIVLVRNDPRDVVGAILLSRAAYRKMRQNLVWATAYNLVAIPAAAGVFLGWGIDLPMSVGALAMSLSTVIVALNAQLLRRSKLGR
ncbi:MAG TPA: heavy metal translocating P-type ATPase [Terriglobales bacterium]|nr:heavy metal translocating P-type ATPase [Terriglobales bacterium]